MMSNEYGLTVYNDNNGLMFDSRRGMNSYVVTEVSSGTGPTVPSGAGTLPISDADFIFVKLPSSLSNSVIYYNHFTSKFYSRTFSISSSNGITNTTWGSPTEATLDFFTVKHSSKVSSTDDYGLIVYNPDGTIQFDSRSVQQSNHFQITSFIQSGFSGAWGPLGGGTSLGPLSGNGDYWEISKWTGGGGISIGSLQITGIWPAGNGPYAINYQSVGGGTGGFPGGMSGTTATETWSSKIYGTIMTSVLT